MAERETSARVTRVHTKNNGSMVVTGTVGTVLRWVLDSRRGYTLDRHGERDRDAGPFVELTLAQVEEFVPGKPETICAFVGPRRYVEAEDICGLDEIEKGLYE